MNDNVLTPPERLFRGRRAADTSPPRSHADVVREGLTNMRHQNALLHRLMRLREMGHMTDSDLLEFGFLELTRALELTSDAARHMAAMNPMPPIILTDDQAARISLQGDREYIWRRRVILTACAAIAGWTAFAITFL